MSNEHTSSQEVETLFRHLRDTRGFRWQRRVSAAWILRHTPLTAEQRLEYRDILRNALLKSEGTGKQIVIAGSRVFALLFPFCLVLAYFFVAMGFMGFSMDRAGVVYGCFLAVWWSIYLSLFCSPILVPFFIFIRANRATQIRLAFIQLLERLRDPMSVDALAFAALDFSSEVSRAANHALLTALPTLTEEHYGQLAAHTVPNLCCVLTDMRLDHITPDRPLLSAILHALEKIGDGRALPEVSYIAETHFLSYQREAQRILPILQARQAREQHSGMLLRAASSPATTPDELLRPAVEATTTEATQLLRASVADSSPP